MAKYKEMFQEASSLILELEDHLDYIGWGDSWEREGSEGLQSKLIKFKRKHKIEDKEE